MSDRAKTTPPSADPKPGRNPGYAENRPRDREDAQQPVPCQTPNPDRGGLAREPEGMPGEDEG